MTAPRDPASPAARRARVAVAALFLTNGALFANVVPRLPEIKAATDLGDAAYGVTIAMMPLGALLSGLVAGRIIRAWGSGPTAVFGTLLLAVAVLAIGLSPAAWALAAALFLVGALDAVVDVAQNAHGLRVQQQYGRSLLNLFHALWSLGGVAGGTMAAIAIALRVPPAVQLAVSGALFSLVAVVALRYCLPGRDEPPVLDAAPDREPGARGIRRVAHPVLLLLGLAAIAVAGALVEDVGSTWATLYLGEGLGAPGAIAAAGYVAVVGAQFVGRLIGDRLVDRFGQRIVARLGGALILCGMGAALAFPSVPGTIAGFAAAGLGIATLTPSALDAAHRIPGLPAGTGLAVVVWLMRVGFLASPIVIGFISTVSELRVSLVLVPVAGLAVVLLAGFLPRRPERSRRPVG